MNKTSEDLTFVYLVEDEHVEETATTIAGERAILELQPFGSEAFRPVPHDGRCTLAPLVARLADGTEVARLPAHTCWDPVYRWVVRQDDLPD